MEDQGKRLLLAVAAAFAILLVWQMLFPPEKPEPETKTEAALENGDGGSKSAERKANKNGANDSSGDAAQERTPVVERGPEALETFDFDRFRVKTTNYGGGIKSWELLGDQFENRDANVPINLVPPLPSDLDQETTSFAVDFGDVIPPNTEWVADRKNDREVIYSWKGNGLEVDKTFRFHPDDYVVEVRVDVTELAGKAHKEALGVTLYQYQDPKTEESGGWTQEPRRWEAGCYVDGELETKTPKKLAKRGDDGYAEVGSVRFAGFVHSYFLAAVSPKVDSDTDLRCEMSAVEQRRGTLRTRLALPVVHLKAKKTFTRRMVAYYGPKYLDKLESISDTFGYDPKFSEAIDLGWFAIIARPMLWLLQWFQSFVINWGIAIILLTFFVKLLTLYWTTKSMRSMKAMSRLQPEVEKIKQKHKDDRQRLQMETMALYKAHNVNMFAGCLPMLLQMPIWFALYKMLMKAAELYQAPFIPGWIDDLTASDPYFVLPILMMGAMFLQSKLTPSTGSSAQQKMLKYGLPLMFGVFGFFFPSGLTIYIVTNTLISAAHHVWLNRDEERRLAAAASKGPRKPPSSNPPSPESPREDSDSSAEVVEPPVRSKGKGSGRKRSGSRKRGKRRR